MLIIRIAGRIEARDRLKATDIHASLLYGSSKSVDTAADLSRGCCFICSFGCLGDPKIAADLSKSTEHSDAQNTAPTHEAGREVPVPDRVLAVFPTDVALQTARRRAGAGRKAEIWRSARAK